MAHPYFDLETRKLVIGPLGPMQFAIVVQLGLTLLVALPDSLPVPLLGYPIVFVLVAAMVIAISVYEKYAPKGYFDHLCVWLAQPRCYRVTRDYKQKQLIVKRRKDVPGLIAHEAAVLGHK
jgi:hypothetical protein